MSQGAVGPGPIGVPDVKVCGLTDPGQARACATAGAWGIGLVFARASTRYIDERAGREISRALPDHVARVGVFVDPEPAAVARLARAVGLTHLQVDGRFNLAALGEAAGLPVVEAVRVAASADPRRHGHSVRLVAGGGASSRAPVRRGRRPAVR
ncbi:MAG TPA: hypothetical protein PKE32_03835 [Miltoncostaeaceae bacterium]|nr:hypothetical protein [Miltoncostaeaceae bacterium]